jgi:cell wall-associated NlpC family hydrolase
MPRRVSPVVLLSLTIVIVLSFSLTAAATPGDDIVPEVATPEQGTAQGESTGPDQAGLTEEVAVPQDVALDEGAAQEKSSAPDPVVTPDPVVAPDEGLTSNEDVTSKEDTTTGEATPEESTQGVEPGAVKTEEAGKEFGAMLSDAEVADATLKNALAEESRLDKEVANTRSDLAGAEDSLGQAQGGLNDRASEIYKHGQDGFLGVLLGAKDFRQFANLLGFWVHALEQDQHEVQTWRDSKNELQQTTDELDAQLQSWEQTREEASIKKEEAQTRVQEAQDFFDALDKQAQQEIEKQQASETELALDHAVKLTQGAAQGKPAEEAPKQDMSAGDEQAPQTAGAGAPDRTPEEEQGRQVEVAQAVADTIHEWPALKQAREAAGVNAEQPAVTDGGATGNTNQNPAAEQLATAAEKQAEAQDQARQAAEQAAKEKQAADEANLRAAEADKAKLAAAQADAAKQEAARNAAEEAQRQAGLAAEQAAKEKQAATDLAMQAKEKLTAADQATNGAQKTAANNPLAPKPGSTGIKPNGTSGSGSAVDGQAKTWLGVPYDYTHMAGETRKAVDCSAFTAAVYRKFGIMLPDSPSGQFGMGTPVVGLPKAGDLVFFSEDGSGVPTHVGIANGDGTLTHASNFTGEVSVTPMKYIKGYIGARRLL